MLRSSGCSACGPNSGRAVLISASQDRYEPDYRVAHGRRSALVDFDFAGGPLIADTEASQSDEGAGRRIAVAGVSVLDAGPEGVVAAVSSGVSNPRQTPYVALAAHVGLLLNRNDAAYRAALNAADLVYADGNSVVLLARLAGARRIRRAVTTDVGWDFIRVTSKALQRPPRIAAIGGPPGLAAKALAVIAQSVHGHGVFSAHGYYDSWTDVLSQLRAAQPDIVLVGMGIPREAVWVHQHLAQLPPALVATCGGWFGYIVGEEERAPSAWRRFGLEWLYRLKQDPGRLAGRYVRGLLALSSLTVTTLWHRWSRRQPHRD